MLTPKNWTTFQHYKDRKPAWIKLHHALLDDYAFARLPIASRALAPCLWLLASEYEAGEITASLEEIAFRLRMAPAELCEAVHPLVESGFFILSNDVAERLQPASASLATPEQVAIPERERETEKETQEKTETEEMPREVRAVAKRDDVSRGTLLPDDWEPSDANIKFASERGIALYAIDIEATKFRNFWTSKTGRDARKRNWDRTWENWILNVKPNGGPNGHRPASSARKSGGDDFLAGLASVASNIAGHGGVARSDTEEIPLGRVNIDG